MSSVAVVVVDLQRDFLDETLRSPFAHWEKAFCVPSTNRLLTYGREHDWQIIHVGTRHESVESLPFHHRIHDPTLYCQTGTPGSEFVVKPIEGDVVLFKSWYSAFDSDLENAISEVDTIVWAGVATDCCIQASVFDADRRQLRNVIPFQAVSASSCESYTTSLTALGKSVASIVEIDDVVAGTDLGDPTIRIHDVKDRAEPWFRAQEARLDLGEAPSLNGVLEQLGGYP